MIFFHHLSDFVLENKIFPHFVIVTIVLGFFFFLSQYITKPNAVNEHLKNKLNHLKDWNDKVNNIISRNWIIYMRTKNRNVDVRCNLK